MRAVVQRVTEADVTVQGSSTGAIQKGLVVLLGVEDGDTKKDADYIADKVSGLRIFDDSEGVMNLSVSDIGGGILSISQFTLLADARKRQTAELYQGSKTGSCKGTYDYFNSRIEEKGITVGKGIFQAEMLVKIYNDGPVIILLDSKKIF